MSYYEYNAKAHYAPFGKHQELITREDLTQLEIVVRDDNEKSESFSIKVPDSIFDLRVYKYLKDGDPFVTSEGYHSARSAYNFQHEPMALWEVQLNFATHCATSGLGVSTEHLNSEQPLVKALYRFHAYNHVRRILKRMLTPLPRTEGFDKYNNAFNLEQVRRIGDEYGCSTKSLGIYENKYYFERTGKYGNYSYEHNNWPKWIVNSSHGFTKSGVEKISESIRAYSYLVLTSQAAARHGILGNTAGALPNFLRQPGRRHQQGRFARGRYQEVPEYSQVRKVYIGLFGRQGIVHAAFKSAVEAVESGDRGLERQDRREHQRLRTREAAQAYIQACGN